MKLSEILAAIQQNPDDMTQLPAAIQQAIETEAREFDYQERISKLQEINRAYLAQIPVTSAEPNKPEKPKEITIEDATANIIALLKGDN